MCYKHEMIYSSIFQTRPSTVPKNLHSERYHAMPWRMSPCHDVMKRVLLPLLLSIGTNEDMRLRNMSRIVFQVADDIALSTLSWQECLRRLMKDIDETDCQWYEYWLDFAWQEGWAIRGEVRFSTQK